MKRNASLCAMVAVALVAVIPNAVAAPTRRRCGSFGDGGEVGTRGSLTFIQSAPYEISMTPTEARRIAARTPPGEFNSHVKPSQVACEVAGAMADSAGQAWLHWHGFDGSVKVTELTYGGKVHLGRFRCLGTTINRTVTVPGVTYHFVNSERCVGGHEIGRIVSTFFIGTD
jgi:hypothetical protein